MTTKTKTPDPQIFPPTNEESLVIKAREEIEKFILSINENEVKPTVKQLQSIVELNTYAEMQATLGKKVVDKITTFSEQLQEKK